MKRIINQGILIMIQALKLIILASVVLFPFSAYALTEGQLKSVKNSVLEICRGGTLEGHKHTLETEGKADVKFLRLKNIFGAGVDAKIKLNESEWKGIEPFVSPDSHLKYNDCVLAVLPILSSNLDSKVVIVEKAKK